MTALYITLAVVITAGVMTCVFYGFTTYKVFWGIFGIFSPLEFILASRFTQSTDPF